MGNLKSGSRRAPLRRPPPSNEGRNAPQEPTESRGSEVAASLPRGYFVTASVVSTCLLGYLYYRAMARIIRVWAEEPDYSHGFLVLPLAGYLAWRKRLGLSRPVAIPGWGGLWLLLAAFGLNALAERYYLVPLAGWSMLVWIGGAIWLLGGGKALRWALPSLLFLSFMVPLPFRLEHQLSWQLQTVTTWLSTAALQCLGQPAVSEGHVLYLGDQVLGIEDACSGLRIFMGIAAVAYVFAAVGRRNLFEGALLLAAVAPVAILANAARVVTAALLMELVSSEAGKRFSHDLAGWMTMFVAAGLYGVLVAWLRRVVIEVERLPFEQTVRRQALAAPPMSAEAAEIAK